jgi:hypothetical protein
MTRYLLLFDSYGLVFWREDGSVFCICCWPLPVQSFSDPSPLGLATIFYCLRFETSRFVVSYDSQGHGGGIQPRLHRGTPSATHTQKSERYREDQHGSRARMTTPILLITNGFSLHSLRSDPMENTVFSCRVFLCYLTTRCSTVYKEHSSYCCVFAETCILSRCLAIGICVTVFYGRCLYVYLSKNLPVSLSHTISFITIIQISKNLLLETFTKFLSWAILIHTSFPSAIQLSVSFGLVNNLSPFFSILHLSSPSFHLHFTEIIMHILQPSQLLRWCQFPFNPSIRGWLSGFWTI